MDYSESQIPPWDDDQTVDETRYRRSFFIGICEGTRHVLRCWKGKDEVELNVNQGQQYAEFLWYSISLQLPAAAPYATVVYNGDGANQGLAELIGEDFAKYKHMCGVFFLNFELGPTQSIPNFTFEVSQDIPLGPIVTGDAASAEPCWAASSTKRVSAGCT